MRKEEKVQILESISAQLQEYPNFYITDISGLNAEQTSKLRRECFERGILLSVVKNTLFSKGIDAMGNEDAAAVKPALEGPTAIMYTNVANAPAKLIKKMQDELREKQDVLKAEKTILENKQGELRISEQQLNETQAEIVLKSNEVNKKLASLNYQTRQLNVSIDQYNAEMDKMCAAVGISAEELKNTGIGSLVFAVKPGDGSAREQAASCQKVLGGWANITQEYATKRYRGNCVNWGMLPFVMDDAVNSGMAVGDIIYLPGVRKALMEDKTDIAAIWVHEGQKKEIVLHLPALTSDERDIIVAGSLINYNRG